MATKRVLDHIRDHLLREVAFAPEEPIPGLERLRVDQWSSAFESAMRAAYARMFGPDAAFDEGFVAKMRNRLLQGAFRYTLMSTQRRQVADYDHFAEVPKRLRLYLETGNGEYLVDAANFCLTTLDVGWWPPRDGGLPPTEERPLEMVYDYRERWTTGAKAALELSARMARMEVVPEADFHTVAARAAFEWSLCGHPNWHFESANDGTGTHMGRA